MNIEINQFNSNGTPQAQALLNMTESQRESVTNMWSNIFNKIVITNS